MPGRRESGAGSENRLDSARIEAARYERITKGLQDAESHALRNRYTLIFMRQTGRLLNYPGTVIDGLGNCLIKRTERMSVRQV